VARAVGAARACHLSRANGQRGPKGQQMTDDHIKRAALSLLSRGLITQSEAARLAGISRQNMRYWARDIDCERARETYLAALWIKKTKQNR
jgi:hypothetical protein